VLIVASRLRLSVTLQAEKHLPRQKYSKWQKSGMQTAWLGVLIAERRKAVRDG
jgi:hypothetical protein